MSTTATGKKYCAKPLEGFLIASDLDGTIVDGDTIFAFFRGFSLEKEAARLDAEENGSDVRVLLERVASRDPIPNEAFARVADDAKLFPGAAGFFSGVESLGARVCILTASYEPIAERVAGRLGLKDAVVLASRLRMAGGKAVGLVGPVIEGKQKEAALLRACSDAGTPLSMVAGIADSEGDAPFMARIKQGGGKCIWVTKPDFRGINADVMNWTKSVKSAKRAEKPRDGSGNV
ncbi:MAG: HAD family hydrolase [Candidatus Micrarchaeia archaeon]